MSDETPKVTVIEINHSEEIPAKGTTLLSASFIYTEAKAREWAESEGILTVYFYDALASAFGYAGK